MTDQLHLLGYVIAVCDTVPVLSGIQAEAFSGRLPEAEIKLDAVWRHA